MWQVTLFSLYLHHCPFRGVWNEIVVKVTNSNRLLDFSGRWAKGFVAHESEGPWPLNQRLHIRHFGRQYNFGTYRKLLTVGTKGNFDWRNEVNPILSV